jgi:small-conductance mechanosensitive channel
LVWRCSRSAIEGLPHVPGHGAGDKENVGVPGRGHELKTKSFYIVDGVILWAAVTGAIALFGRRYDLHFSDWTREERAMVEFLTWLKQSNVNFETLLATIVLLVAASVVIHFLNRFMWKSLRGIERRLSIAYETLLTITRLITGVLWLITAMLILNLWGVSVSGLWTLLVSAAAVIGVGFLAVWTIISHVTANIFITIWRPFQLGQTIELLPENLKGRVIDRNMMFTVVREDSSALLHIPNNLFFQKMFRVSGSRELSHFESYEGWDKDQPAAATPIEGRVARE